MQTLGGGRYGFHAGREAGEFAGNGIGLQNTLASGALQLGLGGAEGGESGGFIAAGNGLVHLADGAMDAGFACLVARGALDCLPDALLR